MRRVVIVGTAGSGKSALARSLGRRLGLPVVHLDALYWQPGWRPVTREAFRQRLAEAMAGDAWITDGNYAVWTFDLRLPRADLVVWVERPRVRCMVRVLRRAIGSHFGDGEDLAAGCKERFDRRFLDRLRYIANFDWVNRPRIEEERAKYGPEVPLVVLRSDAEIARFVAACGR
jgi:adenylate kinase family enzyme